MRDVHRMREKYDLSLDSRQVVSLLIGGIVVLGAVFVLGVLVGKKLAGTLEGIRAVIQRGEEVRRAVGPRQWQWRSPVSPEQRRPEGGWRSARMPPASSALPGR